MAIITMYQFFYRLRCSTKYKKWRKYVLEQDNHTCQKCNTKEGPLHAHHIKPLMFNLDLAFNPDNGLTVCPKCHREIHKTVKVDHRANRGKTIDSEVLKQLLFIKDRIKD